MERVFSHYETWEDYQAGMYKQLRVEGNEELVIKARRLLSNPQEFKNVAKLLIEKWYISAMYNLSNKERNRRAWVGQASCCFKHGTPEVLTRYAWGMLTDIQQKDANNVADAIIKEFERTHTKQCQKRLWE